MHKRYNPEGLTNYNVVPGLMGVILTMTLVMMTSMAMTRERERGTLENLLATPVRPFEVMIGKILPYVLIGYVQVLIVFTAARLLFEVPMFGNFFAAVGGRSCSSSSPRSASASPSRRSRARRCSRCR